MRWPEAVFLATSLAAYDDAVYGHARSNGAPERIEPADKRRIRSLLAQAPKTITD
jgi:hypothetical protein